MKNSKYFEEILAAERVPRWGGFIAQVPDNAAKHVTRTAAILMMLLELEDKVKFSKKDKEKALLCLMSRGMLAMTTGDIKKRVKDDATLSVLLRNAEIGNAEKITENFSKSIAGFFAKNIALYYKDGKIKNIIKAAKDIDNYLFCLREVDIYHNLQYKDKYMLTYNEVNAWTSKFNSVKILLDGIRKQNGYFKFLRYVQDMDQVQRWNLKTLIPDNDAIHAFRVASEAIFLGALEQFKFGHKVNFYDLTLKCLFHDLQEVVVGDIVMPIKYWNGGEVKQRLTELEAEVSIEMSNDIPNTNIKKILLKTFTNAMEDTKEGHLCNVCDQLDAILHAVQELNVGNKFFQHVFDINLEILQKQANDESLMFFFSYILYDLIKR